MMWTEDDETPEVRKLRGLGDEATNWSALIMFLGAAIGVGGFVTAGFLIEGRSLFEIPAIATAILIGVLWRVAIRVYTKGFGQGMRFYRRFRTKE